MLPQKGGTVLWTKKIKNPADTNRMREECEYSLVRNQYYKRYKEK